MSILLTSHFHVLHTHTHDTSLTKENNILTFSKKYNNMVPNINIIQTFQGLRNILHTSWFARNKDIHRDIYISY